VALCEMLTAGRKKVLEEASSERCAASGSRGMPTPPAAIRSAAVTAARG